MVYLYIVVLTIVFYFSAIEYGFKKAINQKSKNETRYVLFWTKSPSDPFQALFTDVRKKNCKFNNCYITYNKAYLEDIKTWDAIVFNAPDMQRSSFGNIPNARSRHQKYVFACKQSAADVVIWDSEYNRFFNWTWTYKLDSDIVWQNIYIKDREGRAVGPRNNMKWMDRTVDFSKGIEHNFPPKPKTIAMMVHDLDLLNKESAMIDIIESYLFSRGLKLDLFGNSENEKCHDVESCFQMFKEYLFYFIFEGHPVQDFHSKELLAALKNSMVPVVLISNHYKNFIPPGSYIDLMSPSSLDDIVRAAKSADEYAKYFWWRNNYTYEGEDESPESAAICSLCEALNNDDRVKKESIVESLIDWWNIREKGGYN